MQLAAMANQADSTDEPAGIKHHTSAAKVVEKNRWAIHSFVRRRRESFRAAIRAGMEVNEVARTFAKVCVLLDFQEPLRSQEFLYNRTHGHSIRLMH